MKLKPTPSPFASGAFVVANEDATLILCNPETEGGLPVQWHVIEGAQAMCSCIASDGFAPFQMLYVATCQDRING